MTEPNSEYFFTDVKGSSIVSIATNVDLNNGIFVSFKNKEGKKFNVQVTEINEFVKVLKGLNKAISEDIISHEKYVDSGTPWTYQEKPYRGLADKYFPLAFFPTINPLIGSQTKGIYSAINSYICFLVGKEVVDDKFEFDNASLDSALEILQQHTSAFSNKITTIGNRNLLGPFDSVKIAALESLYYCYTNDTQKFFENLTIDEYKANTKFHGVYLWATQKGLDEKQLDSRVFFDKPFVFYDNQYFLSDQWTFESTNGRSIENINNFLKIFGCEIIKYQNKYYLNKLNKVSTISLPKPFLLLAGISGTGKTRFVREQADTSASVECYGLKKNDNYCLVPVRPDWHEPSDLLGYISRIGCDGPRYVVTDLLHFIVAAWKHAADSASATQVIFKPLDNICPFWLCLDEMNLAPVEQYFADYLSILETRNWEDGDYSCDPLLKYTVIQKQLDESGRIDFWEKLNLAGEDPLSIGLRDYFSTAGIPLPPNLIVAGTVNMDETTHGFSRKVIDRALTIDFGEFFPNNYEQYYEEDKKIVTLPLNFPRLSKVASESDLAEVAADPDGRKTIGFLYTVNSVLSGTPFELAYRALNEALLSVVCFKPAENTQLQAVWDDFLMMKVLPRIEGDAEKLSYDGDESLLTRLKTVLEKQLPIIWDGQIRPDLLRKTSTGSDEPVECRSRNKLDWMQNRLAVNGFTSFWP